jgi:hypothetical protein
MAARTPPSNYLSLNRAASGPRASLTASILDRRHAMKPHPISLLRGALLADAAVSAATGLLLILAAGPLGRLFGLSPALLGAAGLAFLPWAALCAFAGSRATPPTRLAGAIAVLNILYALASFALPFLGWISPTTAGTVFVLTQGLVVLLLGEAQWIGLRRAARAGTAA